MAQLEINTSPKALKHFNKALEYLHKSKTNEALEEFHRSFSADRENTAKNFHIQLESYISAKRRDYTESLGKIVMGINPMDFEFINKLGNFYRRHKQYQQANNLYRQSLKINRSYDKAVLNLAASMAEVEFYDHEVKNAILKYANFERYILPDPIEFFNEEKKMQVIQILIAEAQRIRDQRIESTIKRKLGPAEEGEIEKIKTEFVQNLPDSIDSPETKTLLEAIIFNHWDKLETEEKTTLKIPLYNLVLKGLETNDQDVVEAGLEKLREIKANYKYLDMLNWISLIYDGLTDQAISGMNAVLMEYPNDRFLNINLGLMYKKAGNKLATLRYLVKGASLIKGLGGNYKTSELIEIAETFYRERKFQKALDLYSKIENEVERIDVWENIGTIYFKMKEYLSAKDYYQKIKKHIPHSALANSKLEEIHDYFFQIAEDYSHKNFNRKAAEFYEKALEVLKKSETLKRASDIFKVLKENQKSYTYLFEYREILEKEKAEKKEIERLELIKQGKQKLRDKDFNSAIRSFQDAFSMKLDRDVFMYLAHIYKALNRQQALTQLLASWKTMSAHEEKQKAHKARFTTQI
ncbi:MAG: hypothetical protein OEY59_06085 [Deltaproteobacteria bacterium]|nr:hypothetical protein [Deltaproteobacteria bacterium]